MGIAVLSAEAARRLRIDAGVSIVHRVADRRDITVMKPDSVTSAHVPLLAEYDADVLMLARRAGHLLPVQTDPQLRRLKRSGASNRDRPP